MVYEDDNKQNSLGSRAVGAGGAGLPFTSQRQVKTPKTDLIKKPGGGSVRSFGSDNFEQPIIPSSVAAGLNGPTNPPVVAQDIAIPSAEINTSQLIKQPDPLAVDNTDGRQFPYGGLEGKQAGNSAIAQPIDTRDYSQPHPAEHLGITNDIVREGNANILARRARGEETQPIGENGEVIFNDSNYDPSKVPVNSPIISGGRKQPSGLTDPMQGRQQMIQDLIKTASAPINSKLSIGKQMELGGERRAAQRTLQMLMGSDTADKNRLAQANTADKNRFAQVNTADKNRESDYTAKSNAAELKGLENTRKEMLSLNKEPRFFGAEDDRIYDLENSEGFNKGELSALKALPRSEGNALAKTIAAMSDEDFNKHIGNGILGASPETIRALFRG